MKNFKLKMIPERTEKPRESGINMVMDKGLSIREAEDLLSVSGDYIDIVKLGFGTSFVTPTLKEKLEVYRSYNVPVYFGGTSSSRSACREVVWVAGHARRVVSIFRRSLADGHTEESD